MASNPKVTYASKLKPSSSSASSFTLQTGVSFERRPGVDDHEKVLIGSQQAPSPNGSCNANNQQPVQQASQAQGSAEQQKSSAPPNLQSLNPQSPNQKVQNLAKTGNMNNGGQTKAKQYPIRGSADNPLQNSQSQVNCNICGRKFDSTKGLNIHVRKCKQVTPAAASNITTMPKSAVDSGKHTAATSHQIRHRTHNKLISKVMDLHLTYKIMGGLMKYIDPLYFGAGTFLICQGVVLENASGMRSQGC